MAKKGFDAKHFPVMQHMTVREVREYLEVCQSVLLPVGVIEQHGYHLPVCTDALVAEGVALRVGRKADMLVGPTLNMSYSGGELPGTVNVHPGVMGMLVSEAIRSLAAQGFRNVFIVLGHGGSENRLALDLHLKMLLRHDRSLSHVLVAVTGAGRFCKPYPKIPGRDPHAGWYETSMVMALAPELVQMEHLTKDTPEMVAEMIEDPDAYQAVSKLHDDEAVVPHIRQRADLRVGVMGRPELASPELGKELLEKAVDGMAAFVEKLERERKEA